MVSDIVGAKQNIDILSVLKVAQWQYERRTIVWESEQMIASLTC